MTTITATQYESLRKLIYDSLISNPEYGLGEMGECEDEARRIVDEWMEENNITEELDTTEDDAEKAFNKSHPELNP